MAASPMNTPEIKFLGWDKPAIELVAEKLEELKEQYDYKKQTIIDELNDRIDYLNKKIERVLAYYESPEE